MAKTPIEAAKEAERDASKAGFDDVKRKKNKVLIDFTGFKSDSDHYAMGHNAVGLAESVTQDSPKLTYDMSWKESGASGRGNGQDILVLEFKKYRATKNTGWNLSNLPYVNLRVEGIPARLQVRGGEGNTKVSQVRTAEAIDFGSDVRGLYLDATNQKYDPDNPVFDEGETVVVTFPSIGKEYKTRYDPQQKKYEGRLVFPGPLSLTKKQAETIISKEQSGQIGNASDTAPSAR